MVIKLSGQILIFFFLFFFSFFFIRSNFEWNKFKLDRITDLIYRIDRISVVLNRFRVYFNRRNSLRIERGNRKAARKTEAIAARIFRFFFLFPSLSLFFFIAFAR